MESIAWVSPGIVLEVVIIWFAWKWSKPYRREEKEAAKSDSRGKESENDGRTG